MDERQKSMFQSANKKYLTTISTTIPWTVVEKIKNNRWKYNDLIMMGIQQKTQMNPLVERLKELENNNSSLQKKLAYLAGQLMEKN